MFRASASQRYYCQDQRPHQLSKADEISQQVDEIIEYKRIILNRKQKLRNALLAVIVSAIGLYVGAIFGHVWARALNVIYDAMRDEDDEDHD